jgi:hypothetical protein
MKAIVVPCASIAFAAALAVGACASPVRSNFFPPPVDEAGEAPDSGLISDDGSFAFDDAPFNLGDASLFGDAAAIDSGGKGRTLSAVHIVPANATVTVNAGSQITQTYTVMGVVDGTGPEVDVTQRFVFYVPDNYLVGGFPTNGGPTFTSRLPTLPTDPPQQGGTLTVQAQASNPGNMLLTTTTSLTVQLQAQLPDPTGATVPANPQSLFGGLGDGGAPDSGSTTTSPDPTRAPTIFYPNEGVMLPPNLKQLEVHWQPGPSTNTLFRVSFDSAAASITYYVRCGRANVSAPGLVAGACALHLDPAGYGYLAQSNSGQGNVALTVAGTDDNGTGYGVSTTKNLQFAQEPVNGGVYYWDVTNTRIMRFDFGGAQTMPDIFLAPRDYGTNGSCVGCHSLSHDGTRIAASQNGQNGGQLIYVNDIAKTTTPPAPARTDPSYLTQDGDAIDHIQFASFNATGDRFVAVYGDTDSTSPGPDGGTILDRNKLWFHDGTTGAIIPGAEKVLPFEPDHPSWSPDGTMIAMTHVGAHHTSQREYSGGIDVATFTNGVLGDPFIVIPSLVPGTNTYNPDFVPDSSFFVFSQSTCPVGQETSDTCDSDVANNLNGTTWAALPVPSATPIHLNKAGSPGLADNGVIPVDTFPRSTPFKTVQGSGQLFWFTVASQRQPGLRQKTGSTQQLLWMFAIDPAQIVAGKDGSFPGFFLPFQDLSTSNHIAQWTQKIVSTTPPPAPPSPPPPPPPPQPPGVPQ